MFVRHDVAVEVAKEREIVADVADGQFVGVGENESGNSAAAQGGMQVNHRLHGKEDVRESCGEFVEIAAELSGGANLLVELVLGDLARFEAEQQRGVVNEVFDLIRRDISTGGDSARG